MVAYWVKAPASDKIDDDGVVRLNMGGDTLLSSITGTTWTKTRLARLSAAVQSKIDNTIPLLSLSGDDPDGPLAAGTQIKRDDGNFTTAALRVEYGERVFLDGAGNIIYRSTLITFTHNGDKLMPRSEVVR